MHWLSSRTIKPLNAVHALAANRIMQKSVNQINEAISIACMFAYGSAVNKKPSTPLKRRDWELIRAAAEWARDAESGWKLEGVDKRYAQLLMDVERCIGHSGDKIIPAALPKPRL